MNPITANVRRILSDLPPHVQLVVAGKGRTRAELLAAVEGGAHILGESYVQEAAVAREVIGPLVQWHFIGHLQRNKARRATALFDMIETVDSASLAAEICRYAAQANELMPILIEVNSGRESPKKGVFPEDVVHLARQISGMSNVRLMGLMTMGPPVPHPADCRPFFSETRRLLETVRELQLPNVEMKYLSMGMTDSYRIAVEEGANLVRIGAGIFGRD